jgi:hypothetical protein
MAARRLAATVQHLALATGTTNANRAPGEVGPSAPGRVHTPGPSTGDLDSGKNDATTPLKIVNITVFGAGLMGMWLLIVIFRCFMVLYHLYSRRRWDC